MENNNKKERIYNELLERIISLTYKPGQVLNEKGISQELGVSRPVIREVFYRLSNLGFIRFIHQIGAQVENIDFRAISEITEIRIEVDKILGKLALRKISKDKIQELRDIVKQIHQLNISEDYSKFIALDHDFHDKMRSACNNALLQSTAEKYYLHVSRMWTHTQAKVTDLVDIIETMEVMVDALENKDEKKLLAAITLHNSSFLKQLQSYLRF
ncbi:MAG: GntR family transcriptional regulator [Promethearchaeota archaeon]